MGPADPAKERREARKAKVLELVTEAIDHAAADAEDRENLCLALQEHLSFDPAYTDIDSLPLRETVERICADLTITPDWSRLEAQDWNPPAPLFHGPWPPPRGDHPPADVAAMAKLEAQEENKDCQPDVPKLNKAQ